MLCLHPGRYWNPLWHCLRVVLVTPATESSSMVPDTASGATWLLSMHLDFCTANAAPLVLVWERHVVQFKGKAMALYIFYLDSTWHLEAMPVGLVIFVYLWYIFVALLSKASWNVTTARTRNSDTVARSSRHYTAAVWRCLWRAHQACPICLWRLSLLHWLNRLRWFYSQFPSANQRQHAVSERAQSCHHWSAPRKTTNTETDIESTRWTKVIRTDTYSMLCSMSDPHSQPLAIRWANKVWCTSAGIVEDRNLP